MEKSSSSSSMYRERLKHKVPKVTITGPPQSAGSASQLSSNGGYVRAVTASSTVEATIDEGGTLVLKYLFTGYPKLPPRQLVRDVSREVIVR